MLLTKPLLNACACKRRSKKPSIFNASAQFKVPKRRYELCGGLSQSSFGRVTYKAVHEELTNKFIQSAVEPQKFTTSTGQGMT
jgi:hypothetical protein